MSAPIRSRTIDADAATKRDAATAPTSGDASRARPPAADPAAPTAADDRYTVPALERGLQLLGLFDRSTRTLTPPEIARRLNLPRSTVFRILNTLEALGFVERTDGGRAVRLGLAVLRLGFEYLASLAPMRFSFAMPRHGCRMAFRCITASVGCIASPPPPPT